jgi:hypothetical protein
MSRENQKVRTPSADSFWGRAPHPAASVILRESATNMLILVHPKFCKRRKINTFRVIKYFTCQTFARLGCPAGHGSSKINLKGDKICRVPNLVTMYDMSVSSSKQGVAKQVSTVKPWRVELSEIENIRDCPRCISTILPSSLRLPQSKRLSATFLVHDSRKLSFREELVLSSSALTHKQEKSQQ